MNVYKIRSKGVSYEILTEASRGDVTEGAYKSYKEGESFVISICEHLFLKGYHVNYREMSYDFVKN